MEANQVTPAGRFKTNHEELKAVSPLDAVELPVTSGEVLLSSGRRYAMEAEPDGDRLTVRARDGQVMLRVTLTDAGPVLFFETAEVELRAMRSLLLEAETVELRAHALRTHVSGDVEEQIGGGRHTRIEAADRLEAATIQCQANEGAIELRAAGRIALDGEHIGLNDDTCPTPFGWSAIAGGPEEGD